MIWKTPVVEDDHRKVNIMDESITAGGIEEEGVMTMSTTDPTGDITVQILEGAGDSIIRRRLTGGVAIIITTAIAEEEMEGEETITMTITPWKKDIVIDRLTITSLRRTGIIASTTITAVGMRNIIGSRTA